MNRGSSDSMHSVLFLIQIIKSAPNPGEIFRFVSTQDATLSTRGELETGHCDSVEFVDGPGA